MVQEGRHSYGSEAGRREFHLRSRQIFFILIGPGPGAGVVCGVPWCLFRDVPNMESSNHDYSLSDSSWWIPWYGQWCPRGLCQLQLPARSCGLSIVNEDEHCPYTFAQSAPRNCLHILLTSTGCVAHSAAAVLWPEYAGSPWPGHHRPQAAQFTMTNISRIKLSQLSSLPISATLWLVLQTNNQRSCTITTAFTFKTLLQ